ncbi:MAG: YcfL family protein [Lentisphaeria bacterium]|jgi:uncharacterized protein YcfL|nr:YcfL family protein [Lentisphaeria bacterium]
MSFPRSLLLASLALAGMLAGCRTVRPPDPRISLDPGIRRKVHVTQFIVHRNAADLVEIQATLSNPGSRTLPLETRVDWFDLEGLKQESLTAKWSSLSISGHTEYSLKVTAPNEAATDFRCYIRESRRN